MDLQKMQIPRLSISPLKVICEKPLFMKYCRGFQFDFAPSAIVISHRQTETFFINN